MTGIGMVFRPSHPPERLLEVARAADESGLDELWLWEDCFENAGISAAGAALGATSRLTLGVGVLPVPMRNAALAAMEIATLARMFPGRVQIGFGHGVLDWMGQVGARAESPMTLLREYVTAVQSLLGGETVTADGRYVRLSDVTLAHPPTPKPPIHVGAVRPKTVALAGELADGMVLTGGSRIADVEAAREIFDAARGGRPGRVTTYLMAVTGPGAAERYAAEYEHWRLTDDPDSVGVHGDAAAIADGVRRWAQAGSDVVVLQPTADDDPVEYARFAGSQVRPLVG